MINKNMTTAVVQFGKAAVPGAEFARSTPGRVIKDFFIGTSCSFGDQHNQAGCGRGRPSAKILRVEQLVAMIAPLS